ncbi:MAG TPA: hypothetical protein DDW50_11260, partial [Firmicutes bacterium]|nr:hypothetical protein [Bacillota bacterium]
MLKPLKARIFIGLNLLCILFLTTVAVCDTKKLIDLDFKNADVKDVLRALAAQNGSNLLIDNEVSGAITIHLTRVTFDNALNIITQTDHLQYVKDDNVYKITQIDNAVINVDYVNNLLSVDAQNAKIAKLIQAIAEKAGQNLVPDPDLNERVSIRLHQIPLQ